MHLQHYACPLPGYPWIPSVHDRSQTASRCEYGICEGKVSLEVNRKKGTQTYNYKNSSRSLAPLVGLDTCRQCKADRECVHLSPALVCAPEVLIQRERRLMAKIWIRRRTHKVSPKFEDKLWRLQRISLALLAAFYLYLQRASAAPDRVLSIKSADDFRAVEDVTQGQQRDADSTTSAPSLRTDARVSPMYEFKSISL